MADDTDTERRSNTGLARITHYLPATPFSSEEPGRVERFLRKHFGDRGPLRADRNDRPPR